MYVRTYIRRQNTWHRCKGCAHACALRPTTCGPDACSNVTFELYGRRLHVLQIYVTFELLMTAATSSYPEPCVMAVVEAEEEFFEARDWEREVEKLEGKLDVAIKRASALQKEVVEWKTDMENERKDKIRLLKANHRLDEGHKELTLYIR